MWRHDLSLALKALAFLAACVALFWALDLKDSTDRGQRARQRAHDLR